MAARYEYINGGYIVITEEDIELISAYPQAPEYADRWCDAHHRQLNAIHYVNGWSEADYQLVLAGLMTSQEYEEVWQD